MFLKSPIFIVACPRSGTTILAALLNRHSDIASATETHFFNYLVDKTLFKKYYSVSELDIFLEKAFNEPRIEDFTKLSKISPDELKAKLLELNDFANPNSFFRAMMTIFLEKQSKQRFCEKTPQHLQSIDKILAEFPDAKIIHLVRDGRDTVNSLLKMPWRPAGLVNNARFWSKYIAMGQAAAERIPESNLLTLRYEDLLTNPEACLKEICDYADLDYQAEMLNPESESSAIFSDWEADWKQKAKLDLDPSRIGAWQKELDTDEQVLLNLVLKNDLVDQGYEVELAELRLEHHFQKFCAYAALAFQKIFRIAQFRSWLILFMVGMLGLMPMTTQAKSHPEILRGPYLQMLSQDSVVIKWKTDKEMITELKYGSSSSDVMEHKSNRRLSLEHRVEIKHLKPGTKYHYVIPGVEGQNVRKQFFMTVTEKPDDKAIIWVLGDSGTKGSRKILKTKKGKKFKNAQEEVNAGFFNYIGKTISQEDLDFVIMLGDNAYDYGTVAEYDRSVFPVYKDVLANKVVYPCYGNHDGGFHKDNHSFTARSYPEEEGPYYDLFELPTKAELGGVASHKEAYYSYDYGHAHFVVLDSYDSLWEDLNDDGSNFEKIWELSSHQHNAMLDWLKRDIEAAQSREENPWIVVYFHHTAHTMQKIGAHTKHEGTWMRWMKNNVSPLLESKKVDLVLAGHVHRYERTFPIFAGQRSSTELKNYKRGSGTIYVVNGTGGSYFESEDQDPAPSQILMSKRTLGSQLLTITKDKLVADYIGIDGQVIDTFNIKR